MFPQRIISQNKRIRFNIQKIKIVKKVPIKTNPIIIIVNQDKIVQDKIVPDRIVQDKISPDKNVLEKTVPDMIVQDKTALVLFLKIEIVEVMGLTEMTIIIIVEIFLTEVIVKENLLEDQ